MQTKKKILRVATEHYLQKGLSGLSLRKIAREIGISPTAIYRHFEHKQALIFALIAEGYAEFAVALRTPTTNALLEYALLDFESNKSSQSESIRSLQSLCGRYALFVLEEKPVYELLFLSVHHLGSGKNEYELPPLLQDMGRDSLWILVSAVEAAIEAGELRKVPALDASRMLWAQLHGLAALFVTRRLGVSDAQFLRLCMEGFASVLAGLSVR
ncbi:MAG: TetR/AcrR family transcriptional regulator [Deltaproteobacteria bacterium]|nr:TetR/AcrR family transcriptional regulator [Deltaproteobacteria bacterium]